MAGQLTLPLGEAFAIKDSGICNLFGDDLREAIHRHLRRYPGLDAGELARALHLPSPSTTGRTRVSRMLKVMAEDGEAEEIPNPGRSSRTARRWNAT